MTMETAVIATNEGPQDRERRPLDFIKGKLSKPLERPPDRGHLP
jgi:hypothetical protein